MADSLGPPPLSPSVAKSDTSEGSSASKPKPKKDPAKKCRKSNPKKPAAKPATATESASSSGSVPPVSSDLSRPDLLLAPQHTQVTDRSVSPGFSQVSGLPSPEGFVSRSEFGNLTALVRQVLEFVRPATTASLASSRGGQEVLSGTVPFPVPQGVQGAYSVCGPGFVSSHGVAQPLTVDDLPPATAAPSTSSRGGWVESSTAGCHPVPHGDPGTASGSGIGCGPSQGVVRSDPMEVESSDEDSFAPVAPPTISSLLDLVQSAPESLLVPLSGHAASGGFVGARFSASQQPPRRQLKLSALVGDELVAAFGAYGPHARSNFTPLHVGKFPPASAAKLPVDNSALQVFPCLPSATDTPQGGSVPNSVTVPLTAAKLKQQLAVGSLTAGSLTDSLLEMLCQALFDGDEARSDPDLDAAWYCCQELHHANRRAVANTSAALAAEVVGLRDQSLQSFSLPPDTAARLRSVPPSGSGLHAPEARAVLDTAALQQRELDATAGLHTALLSLGKRGASERPKGRGKRLRWASQAPSQQQPSSTGRGRGRGRHGKAQPSKPGQAGRGGHPR